MGLDEIPFFIHASQLHVFSAGSWYGAAHGIGYNSKPTQVDVLGVMDGIALITMMITNCIFTDAGHPKTLGHLDEKHLDANGFSRLCPIHFGLDDWPAQSGGFGNNICPRGRGAPALVSHGVGDDVICQCGGFINKDRKSTRLNSSHVAISYA